MELAEDTEEHSGVNVQSFVAEQEWHLHETVHSWTKVRYSLGRQLKNIYIHIDAIKQRNVYNVLRL